MSAQASMEGLMLLCTAFMVGFRVVFFTKVWNLPLNHGSGYFLGVEVPPGFYEGAGAGWLRRYHQAWIVEVSVEVIGLVGVIAAAPRLLIPWWVLLPLYGGFFPILGVTVVWALGAYTRAKLGGNRPVRSSFAVPLEARRLSDYIAWPREALMALLTALSWGLILMTSARLSVQTPVLMTYVVVGLFPFKMGVVRKGFSIPAERPEEHHEWMKAQRRLCLRTLDSIRWTFLLMIGDYAAMHAWRTAGSSSLLRWLNAGVVLGVGLYLALSLVRDERRVVAMGRDLRPASSWSTPFRPAWQMQPALAPFAVWFGGLILLLVFLRP